jgi:hypothetical protein
MAGLASMQGHSGRPGPQDGHPPPARPFGLHMHAAGSLASRSKGNLRRYQLGTVGRRAGFNLYDRRRTRW